MAKKNTKGTGPVYEVHYRSLGKWRMKEVRGLRQAKMEAARLSSSVRYGKKARVEDPRNDDHWDYANGIITYRSRR